MSTIRSDTGLEFGLSCCSHGFMVDFYSFMCDRMVGDISIVWDNKTHKSYYDINKFSLTGDITLYVNEETAVIFHLDDVRVTMHSAIIMPNHIDTDRYITEFNEMLGRWFGVHYDFSSLY